MCPLNLARGELSSTFENLEGLDQFNSEGPVFQKGEVELVKRWGPLTRRVARHWMISSWLTSASITCSRCGRTMVQYNGINAALDKSENDRLAVFAASLQ